MPLRSFVFAGLTLVLIIGGCGGRGDTEGQKAHPSQPARIYVDGEGADWDSLAVRYFDLEDGGDVGIQRLWTAHSDRYVFLRLELSQAVNLQEDSGVTLALDSDADSTTGENIQGIGAELVWHFGERSGRFEGTEIEHADIALTSLPTVRSESFEIALDRSATPNDSDSLFQGDSLRLALSSGGDRLPSRAGGVGYALTDERVDLEAPSIDRPDTSALRLMSYNAVNNFDRELNSLFIEERQPSYRRILGAIGPDVVAFQEVYDQTADEVERTAEGELGLATNWEWAKEGRDLVLGSRFSILDSHSISGYEDYESGAFLLDTRDTLGTRLVVVNIHPPCCNDEPEGGEPSSDAQRQRVVDGVIAFIRTIKKGEGPFDVPSETPIAILGDMNFVGAAQQPLTLRTGEIVNKDIFGSSVAPDWDDSGVLDTNPQQVDSPMHTTWIDTESPFPPGRLDYAYVTDSVLDVVHEFVLYTPALSDSTRRSHDLQANDTDTASDHLPVVIDVQPQ